MTATPELFHLPAALRPGDALFRTINHVASLLEALGTPRNHPEVTILQIARRALDLARRHARQAARERQAGDICRATYLEEQVTRLLWLAESRAEAVSIYRNHY
jgi:hypothetical protein